MTCLFLGIFLIALLSAYYFGKDIFSPSRMFICVYSLVLAVNALHLSGYQTPWAQSTHFLFWGGLVCFVAGSWLIHMVDGIRNPLVKVDQLSVRSAITADASQIDWKWFSRILGVCVAIFLVSYLVSYLISGTIPIFASGASADKTRLAFFGASLLTNFGIFAGPIALILGSEYLLFGKGSRRRLIAVGCLWGITLLFYLTIITRLDLFRAMLFAVIMYHYGRKRLKLWHLFSAAALFAAMFLVIFFMRVQYDTFGMWVDASKVHIPKEFLWCANLYTYIVNNFWNFDFAVRKYVDGVFEYPRQWGFSLSRPVFGLLFLGTSFAQSNGFDSIMNESVTMLKGLNTIVFHWHFYKDFGAFGVYFLPLLFGTITTVFYVNTMHRPSLSRVAVWAQVVPLIVFSFSFALWEFWFVYVNFAIIAAAHRPLGTRQGVNEAPTPHRGTS
jgi:oligosaccharide repeat unit polymerase